MVTRHNTKRLLMLLLLPVSVLIIGTVVFMLLEGLSFLDALYFTLVTVSTVGYGDIHPVTIAGKIFSIVLIIVGIGTFLTIVTSVAQTLVQRGQNRLRRQRLNMIIGVFFIEVGNQLLRLFVRFDTNIGKIRDDFVVKSNWDEADFANLTRRLRDYDFTIDTKKIELDTLHKFLKEKGDLLLRQIENPDLIEHESFTGLLWAVIHLRNELMSRESLIGLPQNDVEHLVNDAKRAYILLARQWLSYLRHLKRSYPYLYSLALRANPYVETTSVIIE